MNRIFFIVGAGGFFGSVSRYYSSLLIARLFSSPFPFGTFFINITGCFLIGIFYGVADRSDFMQTDWRLFLTAGFCGGFTTFSAFSFESIRLMQQGAFFTFSLYVIASVVTCLLATYLGISIVKAI